MTTEELVAAIRVRLDDVIRVPALCSNATILEHLSLAQTEFARTTLALYNVVEVQVLANAFWLELPSNFCVLKTAILSGSQLRPVTASELDFGYYTLNNIENFSRFDNWRAATGTPKFLVVDMYPSKVRLVPYPNTNITLSVEGYTIPSALAIDSVNPEIPEMYHELLIAGALLRLYALLDIDTLNSNKAQVYGTQWYQGLVEAQNNLRTSLRRQVRVMELPRGFVFDIPAKAPAIGVPANES